MTPTDIISDAEIERVHANANFGDMDKRDVVTEGVIKYMLGYTGGYTQLCILVEHGLVRRGKPGSYRATLTAKGRRYFTALFADRINDLVKLAGAR